MNREKKGRKEGRESKRKKRMKIQTKKKQGLRWKAKKEKK